MPTPKPSCRRRSVVDGLPVIVTGMAWLLAFLLVMSVYDAPSFLSYAGHAAFSAVSATICAIFANAATRHIQHAMGSPDSGPADSRQPAKRDILIGIFVLGPIVSAIAWSVTTATLFFVFLPSEYRAGAGFYACATIGALVAVFMYIGVGCRVDIPSTI